MQNANGRPSDMMLVMRKWIEAGLAAVVILGPPHFAFEDHQEQFVALFVWAVLAAIIVGSVGALLLLLTVGLLAGLIAAGVVSASVVIGVLRRSVSTGFRALFFQIGGVFGLIAGSLGAWVFIVLAKLPMTSVQPWVIGPLVGIAFGLLAAWMFNFAWGRSVEWIARKLPRRKVVEVEGEVTSETPITKFQAPEKHQRLK